MKKRSRLYLFYSFLTVILAFAGKGTVYADDTQQEELSQADLEIINNFEFLRDFELFKEWELYDNYDILIDTTVE
ncbi:MAG: hypothetical protein ABH868_05835 [bacterium]